MTQTTVAALSEPLAWPEGGVARVPFRVFSDAEIYALEQEKIFKGPIWNFLCMEVDVAKPGDVRTTWVGETPVVVTHDQDEALEVADRIVVMEEGRVVQEGTHQSLMAQGGLYAHLAELQFRAD